MGLRYKVGDKVRVKQWDDMAIEFEVDEDGDIYIDRCDIYFSKKMGELCGKVLSVARIEGDVYIMDGADWQFSDEMLEPVFDEIKDSGERTTFDTGAVRDLHTGKGRMDLLPFHAILDLSKHCENGAMKYDEHNVEKGIPQHSLIDSGMRHLFKYASGETDEDHLLSALWNIAWAVNQRKTHPELIDVPWKGRKENV